MASFDQLQVEGDAHAIDQDNALIQKLLIGDLGVYELAKSSTRADKFYGLGGPFGPRGQFVQNGKIKKLKFEIRWDFLRKILQLRGKKKIEALRRPLINRTLHRPELKRIPQSHLKSHLTVEDHECGRSVIDKMEFGGAIFGEGGQLHLVLLAEPVGIGLGGRRSDGRRFRGLG